ncbi:MAG: hypothetical protein IPO57_07230 [Rhodocyclales bacterium]|nr:hypothetical protein [Rhodocyclales bacterium]
MGGSFQAQACQGADGSNSRRQHCQEQPVLPGSIHAMIDDVLRPLDVEHAVAVEQRGVPYGEGGQQQAADESHAHRPDRLHP